MGATLHEQLLLRKVDSGGSGVWGALARQRAQLPESAELLLALFERRELKVASELDLRGAAEAPCLGKRRSPRLVGSDTLMFRLFVVCCLAVQGYIRLAFQFDQRKASGPAPLAFRQKKAKEREVKRRNFAHSPICFRHSTASCHPPGLFACAKALRGARAALRRCAAFGGVVPADVGGGGVGAAVWRPRSLPSWTRDELSCSGHAASEHAPWENWRGSVRKVAFDPELPQLGLCAAHWSASLSTSS